LISFIYKWWKGISQFKVVHLLYRNYSAEKLAHLDCMCTLWVIEINAILDFLDIYSILVCIVFQNELFQVKKCTFVLDLLANLNYGFPSVSSGDASAFVALLIWDDVLELENLLEDRWWKDFLLDREFYLDPPAVRLRKYFIAFGADKQFSNVQQIWKIILAMLWPLASIIYLCPNESCVHQTHFIQTLQFF